MEKKIDRPNKQKNEPKSTKSKKTSKSHKVAFFIRELHALLSCPSTGVILDRANSRVLPLLEHETWLRQFWVLAESYENQRQTHEQVLVDRFEEFYGKFRLGSRPEISSQKPSPNTYLPTPKLWWLETFRTLLLETKPNHSDLTEDEDAFFLALLEWDYFKANEYSIGSHPYMALAVFKRACKDFCQLQTRIKTLNPLNLMYSKDVKDELNRLSDCIKLSSENLINELPNISTWSQASLNTLTWQMLAIQTDIEMKKKDPTTPRTDISRATLKKLPNEINVKENTIYKFLKEYDLRSHEQKNTHKGRPSNKRGS